jgi:hypothetical protein
MRVAGASKRKARINPMAGTVEPDSKVHLTRRVNVVEAPPLRGAAISFAAAIPIETFYDEIRKLTEQGPNTGPR